jgi:hypothetical protein
MKTIKLNGKQMDVSATEERALKVLLMNDFAAMKSDFWLGSPRHLRSVLPRDRNRAHELGIVEMRNFKTLGLVDDAFWSVGISGKRAKAFFRDHPRCESGIFANVRRVKAILSAIDKGESQ